MSSPSFQIDSPFKQFSPQVSPFIILMLPQMHLLSLTHGRLHLCKEIMLPSRILNCSTHTMVLVLLEQRDITWRGFKDSPPIWAYLLIKPMILAESRMCILTRGLRTQRPIMIGNTFTESLFRLLVLIGSMSSIPLRLVTRLATSSLSQRLALAMGTLWGLVQTEFSTTASWLNR